MRKLFFVFLFLPILAQGQQPLPDSLATRLQATSGTEKVAVYHDIVFYFLRGQFGSARHYMQQAKALAADLNQPLADGYVLLNEGAYYNAKGGLDSAVYFLKKADSIGQIAADPTFQIKVSSSLGKALIAIGQPEKALEKLFDALRLLNNFPNRESELKVRVNIMWAYLELKQYENCITIGRASANLIQPRFEWMTSYFFNNLAISYGALKKIDSAEYFVKQSIALATKHSEWVTLANGYFILGNIYANEGNLALAIEQYQKAKPIRQKIGNPFFIVADLYTLADLYYKRQEFGKGIEAGLEALTLAEKNNLLMKFEGVYEALAKNYAGQHDYQNASRYFQLWAIAKDSVYKNANASSIAEMRTKYESERKEQQIIVQNLQLAESQAALRNTYVIIVALVIITALVILILILARNRFRKKQELLRKENEILIREAYLQATLQSQEMERKRFAQDLHDSMGQLISALRMVLSSTDKNSSLEQRVHTVTKAERILDEMHKEIRSVAFNLMPQTLIQKGLVPALEEMAQRIQQSGGLAIDVKNYEMPVRLSELQEISLYRVLQEWTGNLLKHSSAQKMAIQLVRHDNEIVITAEDDGAGFDFEKLRNSQGNGWKNIQARLKSIKAMADVDTQAGRKGTTFTISMPLKAGILGSANPKVESVQ